MSLSIGLLRQLVPILHGDSPVFFAYWVAYWARWPQKDSVEVALGARTSGWFCWLLWGRGGVRTGCCRWVRCGVWCGFALIAYVCNIISLCCDHDFHGSLNEALVAECDPQAKLRTASNQQHRDYRYSAVSWRHQILLTFESQSHASVMLVDAGAESSY